MPTNTATWLDEFIKEQQAVNAARDAYWNSHTPDVSGIQFNVGGPTPNISTPYNPPPTSGGFTPDMLRGTTTPQYNVPAQNVAGSPTLLERIFDPIERALGGVSSLATGAVKEFRGQDTSSAGRDLVDVLTGKKKSTFIDTAKAAGLNDAASALVGGLGNLFLDPANFVVGPVGALAVKGVKAGKAAVMGTTTAAKAAKAAEEYRLANEAAKPDLSASTIDPSVIPPGPGNPPAGPGAVPPPDPTLPPPAPGPVSAATLTPEIISTAGTNIPKSAPRPAPVPSPVGVPSTLQSIVERNPVVPTVPPTSADEYVAGLLGEPLEPKLQQTVSVGAGARAPVVATAPSPADLNRTIPNAPVPISNAPAAIARESVAANNELDAARTAFDGSEASKERLFRAQHRADRADAILHNATHGNQVPVPDVYRPVQPAGVGAVPETPPVATAPSPMDVQQTIPDVTPVTPPVDADAKLVADANYRQNLITKNFPNDPPRMNIVVSGTHITVDPIDARRYLGHEEVNDLTANPAKVVKTKPTFAVSMIENNPGVFPALEQELIKYYPGRFPEVEQRIAGHGLPVDVPEQMAPAPVSTPAPGEDLSFIDKALGKPPPEPGAIGAPVPGAVNPIAGRNVEEASNVINARNKLESLQADPQTTKADIARAEKNLKYAQTNPLFPLAEGETAVHTITPSQAEPVVPESAPIPTEPVRDPTWPSWAVSKDPKDGLFIDKHGDKYSDEEPYLGDIVPFTRPPAPEAVLHGTPVTDIAAPRPVASKLVAPKPVETPKPVAEPVAAGPSEVALKAEKALAEAKKNPAYKPETENDQVIVRVVTTDHGRVKSDKPATIDDALAYIKMQPKQPGIQHKINISPEDKARVDANFQVQQLEEALQKVRSKETAAANKAGREAAVKGAVAGDTAARAAAKPPAEVRNIYSSPYNAGDHVKITFHPAGHADITSTIEGKLIHDPKNGSLYVETNEVTKSGARKRQTVVYGSGKAKPGVTVESHTPGPVAMADYIPPEREFDAEGNPIPTTGDILKEPPAPLPVHPQPTPDEVRAAAGSIPDDPADALPIAQRSEEVIKNKPKSVELQAQLLHDVRTRHLNEAKRASLSRVQTLGNAARNTQQEAQILDREFHQKGGNYQVKSGYGEFDPDLQADRPWDIGVSDVMAVIGAKGIERAVIDPASRLSGEQLLRMGAAALTARSTGNMAEQSIQAYVEHVGNMLARGTSNMSHNKVITDMSYLLTRNVNRLAKRVHDNSQMARDAITESAGLVAHTAEAQIAHDTVAANGGSQAAAVDTLSNIGGMTNKLAGGNEAVAAAAAPVIGEDVAKTIPKTDIAHARQIDSNATSYKDPKKKPAAKKATATANAAVAAQADVQDIRINVLTVTPAWLPIDDVESIMEAAKLDAIASGKFHPVATLTGQFAPKGHAMAVAAVNGTSFTATEHIGFMDVLNKVAKPYTKDEHHAAFAAMRAKTWPTSERELALTKQLVPLMEQSGIDMSAMGTGIPMGGDPLKGSAWAQEYLLSDIQRALEEQGIPKAHIIPSQDELNKLIKDNPEKTERMLLADWWTHNQPEDPIARIGQLHAAFGSLSLSSSLGTDFAQYGSLIQKPGYIRLADTLDVPGGSVGWQYIPRVDVKGRPIYYPKEGAVWFVHTERAMAEARGFTQNAGPIRRFITGYLDPIVATWKTSVTVAKPSYLVRNFNGDVFLNFLAGVWHPSDYKDAFILMHAGGRLKDRTIESMQRNLMSPNEAVAVGTRKFPVTLKNGKSVTVNDQAMFNLAKKEGVTLSYSLSADVIQAKVATGGMTAPQRMYSKVQANRLIQKGSQVNEEVSHIPRLAQFAHHMKDPKFTSKFHTIEEAAKYAAAEVRKYHPDVSGLSASGQNVMRRIIPFYSWTRLVTPMILEKLLTHPNRVTAIPKIFQAANAANGNYQPGLGSGIDPTRLVPTFSRQKLGSFGDYTFDTGSPAESLAQTFPGSNMQDVMRGGVYNMVSPLIKAPIDLISGVNQETNAGIVDKSDYIDQAIPFFGDIAQVSGVSPSGSIGQMITGQGVIDPQRAVQQGEKNYFLNTGVIGFLSGLQPYNFTRPSALHIAQSQYKSGVLGR